MIIQFFNYIFQSFFSLFYNEINSLNDLILDKNHTIKKFNKTIRNLKSEIKILKGTSSETIHETSISLFFIFLILFHILVYKTIFYKI